MAIRKPVNKEVTKEVTSEEILNEAIETTKPLTVIEEITNAVNEVTSLEATKTLEIEIKIRNKSKNVHVCLCNALCLPTFVDIEGKFIAGIPKEVFNAHQNVTPEFKLEVNKRIALYKLAGMLEKQKSLMAKLAENDGELTVEYDKFYILKTGKLSDAAKQRKIAALKKQLAELEN